MPSFKLDIVTPEKTVYSGTVDSFRAPGTEGGFGVLVRHHPMVASLDVGRIRFREEGGADLQMATSGGFAEVLGDHVTVLAETAESEGEIDVSRAEASSDRARDRLQQEQEGVDRARAEASLARALNRLSVAGGV